MTTNAYCGIRVGSYTARVDPDRNETAKDIARAGGQTRDRQRVEAELPVWVPTPARGDGVLSQSTRHPANIQPSERWPSDERRKELVAFGRIAISEPSFGVRAPTVCQRFANDAAAALVTRAHNY